MPNPFLHVPLLVLLFPLGIFRIAKTSCTSGKAFRQAWFAAAAAYSSSLYWLAIPVHDFAYLAPQINVPWALAIFCPVLLGAYLGLFPAVFALILSLARLRNRNWFALGIFSGLLWACLELLRGLLFTGFPWLDLPTAFAPWPVWLQHLRFWGVPGANVLFVAGTIWFCAALKNRYPLPPLLAAVLLFSLLNIDGHFRIKNNRPENTEQHTVRLVQGNIPQQEKWYASEQKRTVDTYILLSDGNKEQPDADLIIWPETAIPLYLQDKSLLGQNIRALAARKRVHMLIGSPAYREQEDGTHKLYNRAYLLSPFGELLESYDKQHLVPFGEYIPFKSYFPSLARVTTDGPDFSPGTQTAPLYADPFALGVMICYEVIFPDTAQQRVAAGSNVLINISNDAWFAKSSAPEQHLNAAVLRSIEQNRVLLRATNTGISAIIDNTGTVIARTELFTSTELTRTLPLTREETTFYHRNYSWLRMAFPVTFFLFVCCLPRIKRKWKNDLLL